MKNSKAVSSMVIGIITFCLMIIAPTNYTYIIIVGVLGIIPIVLSVIAKKELKEFKKGGEKLGKKESKIGMILGIVTIVLSLMYILSLRLLSDVEVASMAYCPNQKQVSSCEYNDDGKTSKCLFMGTMELNCKNEVLKPNQYKDNVQTPSDDQIATNEE